MGGCSLGLIYNLFGKTRIQKRKTTTKQHVLSTLIFMFFLKLGLLGKSTMSDTSPRGSPGAAAPRKTRCELVVFSVDDAERF